MKKNNKWLTLTLSLTFLLLAGACAGVASSLSGSNSISIEQSSKENINNVDKNLLNDNYWWIGKDDTDSTLKYVELNYLELTDDYQYFVFKISNFSSLSYTEEQNDYIAFDNDYVFNNFLNDMNSKKHMCFVISYENSDDIYTYITFKYRKSRTLDSLKPSYSSINGANVVEFAFCYKTLDDYDGPSSSWKNNQIYAAAYQNNDGIMLDPTTLF